MSDIFSSADIDTWLATAPYARRLGISAMDAPDGEGLLFCLEPRDGNIGNILLPALHGGVVAAFMETAATLDLMRVARTQALPRIVDMSIDYLRTARVVPTFARCEVLRQGRRLANVRVSAWQDDPAAPVVTARLHFMTASSQQRSGK